MRRCSNWVRGLFALCVVGVLTACSGGLESTDGPEAASAKAPLDADEIALARIAATSARPDTNWQPPSGATPKNINYLYLQSDATDPLGGGKTYLYTQADAVLSVQADGLSLYVAANGDESWSAQFQEPSSFTRLKRGLFSDIHSVPSPLNGDAGMSVTAPHWGCSFFSGWFALDEVEYENGKLVAIVLRFAQTCDGSTGALHGKLRWNVGDRTAPPDPVYPPPANLWQPPAGSTPASGSYVFLQGEAGDPLLNNASRLWTKADALMSVTSVNGRVDVSVSSNETWTGVFKAMDKLTELKRGYYGGLIGYPVYNRAKGGLVWSGSVGGCTSLTGWFVVDAVTFVNGALATLDLRFEQHCNGIGPALHGKIHWDANDPTQPAGPVNPPPATLWQPAAGATPAAGNYVYVQSEVGDPVGAGGTYLHTLASAFLAISSSSNQLFVSVNGIQHWAGQFQAMGTLTTLQPGYYGDLLKLPNNNPAKGGLQWFGDRGGCTTATGWFALDSVTYTNGSVSAIDLRFEQRCDGAAGALHGKIHWVDGDTTGSAAPIVPPPATLWDAAPGATPATGSYVYLQSEAGDFIGGGGTFTYTGANANLAISGAGPAGFVNVIAGAQSWSGVFAPMRSLALLQPGYYPDVTRFPGQNPFTGNFAWTGNGRNCNAITGWFVVDAITYNGPTPTALDLRFEQHCEGAVPALRGKIHWVLGQ